MRPLTTSFTALLIAFAAGCSGAGSARDADDDGAPDGKDLCEATAAGTTVGSDGCTADEDGDSDGVGTADDLCPGTDAASETDAFGCSAAQREAGAGSAIFGGVSTSSGTSTDPSVDPATGEGTTPGTPGTGTLGWAEDILQNPPATGTVTNGFMALVIDPNGEHPMVFHTFATNVTESANGYDVGGSLFLTTPLGQIPIASARVTFAYGSDRALGLETVRGDASVPFPGLGFLGGVETSDLVSASLGLDRGANLADLDAPLVDDRQYLFFHYEHGFSASSGPITFEAPGGEGATLVLDPADPFVFLSGSLLGLDALGPIENAGIGLSLRGFIPFAPATTWGLTDGMGEFDGHVYVRGSVPLRKIPMTLSGELVVDLDPAGEGRTLVEMDQPGTEIGFNGSVDFTVGFLEYFSFEANLADASVGLKITEAEQRAYVSGVVEPDRSFLPDELPLRVRDRLSVAGVLSQNIEQSYLVAEGRYALDGSGLGRLTGLPIGDLGVADARLEIDRNGFHLVGALEAGVSIAPQLSLGADARVDAQFSDDPADFHVDIDGDLTVAGVHLVEAEARISSAGVAVSGKLDNGITRVLMTGTITSSSFELHGEASVSIDVSAGKEVVELVTDGAICGYEAVRDGGLCGYEVVSSGAVCGYEKITDGGVCGYEIVTDGGRCGYETVTSLAICGGTMITDGLQCGTHQVCDTLFGWTGLCDSIPNSCEVPATCTNWNAPKSCTNFDLPKTCDDLTRPKTCEDLAHPKTCEDLGKPRTCEHHDVIPDYDFGSVVGSIGITLGTQGLSGSVEGRYCPTGGSCATLVGGRLGLGSPMEACIDVPGGLGEFCAPF